MIDIAVIILGFHNIESLKEGFIENLQRQLEKLEYGMTYRIVYIDNYSCDGSVRYLKEKDYDIDILMCVRNLMYEESNNLGIQYAYKKYDPRFYLLIDADNMVREDAIKKLVEYMIKHDEVGIVQPMVLMYDDVSVYSMGHYFNEEGKCRLIREKKEQFDLNDLESCSILCTLFRKEVFCECGLLNPVFEIYYESSDIAFRARKAGFKIACCEEAIAYNDGTNVKNIENYHGRYYMDRNRLLFWYIHDRDRFEAFKLKAEEKMRFIRNQIENTIYGVGDTALLAEHNAIFDALQIVNSGIDISKEVLIEDYDKYKIVVF